MKREAGERWSTFTTIVLLPAATLADANDPDCNTSAIARIALGSRIVARLSQLGSLSDQQDVFCGTAVMFSTYGNRPESITEPLPNHPFEVFGTRTLSKLALLLASFHRTGGGILHHSTE